MNNFFAIHSSLFILLLSISHLSLIYLSLLYSSLIYPASSLAGRTPPYGGIARPKGKHSRHKAVFCPSPLIPGKNRIRPAKG
jgi:hypothetical protein